MSSSCYRGILEAGATLYVKADIRFRPKFATLPATVPCHSLRRNQVIFVLDLIWACRLRVAKLSCHGTFHPH
jgi:hypothetical protein